ncbi:type II toxin-antitoxin system VapC family toxin [Tautonia sp. JC769]|uniref:type II toxin-antitoxin system VapC family toxin n=1 Tax=Tautonia sp. JC769 TaxID=3232135 RepID=UPI003458224D
MILLDTDLVTILLRGTGRDRQRLSERLRDRSAEAITTTIITYEEQTRGWLAYVSKARTMPEQIVAYQRLQDHLDCYRRIDVVPFDEQAAIEFQRLRQARVRIGTMDLKIAAIALARDATLVTRNLGDFARVPGLRAEDWTSDQESADQ